MYTTASWGGWSYWSVSNVVSKGVVASVAEPVEPSQQYIRVRTRSRRRSQLMLWLVFFLFWGLALSGLYLAWRVGDFNDWLWVWTGIGASVLASLILLLTLPRLKPGGSGSSPATSGPCQGRYSDGAEILDGIGLHRAVAAIRRPRADVGAAVHIPMHPRAAAQTPKAAPARRGRLDVPTVTTGSRRVRLVDPLYRDPQARGLLGKRAGELPMRPLADLLIGSFAQAHSRLDVAHISHRDAAHPVLRAEIHHLARRLVEEVTLLAIQSGAHLCLTPAEPLGATRTGLAAAQVLRQHAVNLVAPLLARAQLPPREDESMPTRRGHRRSVDLAQIHPSGLPCQQRRGQRCSGIERQTQLIVIRPVIRPPGQLHPTQVGLAALPCCSPANGSSRGGRCPPQGRRSLPEGKTVSA